MSYRSDLDALEAREAALAKELERATSEHADARKLLDEARASDVEVERAGLLAAKRRRRRRLAGALGAVAAAGAIVYLRVGPGAGTRPLTCAEAEPKRLAAEAATQQAYERALAAKRLTPVALEHILFDDWHIEAERAANQLGSIALDRMPIAVEQVVTDTRRECGNVPPLVDQALRSGEVFPLTYAGRQRSALAGWFEDDSGRDALATELVADDAGGVWRVARVPRITSSARHDVQACPWGCGGPPSPVPRTCVGGAWLLPDGRRYRGEMKISYDATVVDFNPIDVGLNCTLPP